ncbi:TPA: ash family protein [Yersinia enterocolitica]|nr:ash family protein [Yersinia enterocolitica]HDL7504423.1 ash family protein [Yersinia enterocolitica]
MIFYFFLAGALQYNLGAVAKSVAGISVPKIFLIPSLVIQTWFFIGMACAHPSMVAQAGAPKGAPVSKKSGNANSVWATTQGISVSGGSHYNYFLEAAQWLLPFTVYTRNTFVPIRGCAMLYDPTPLTSAELTDHCCALAYAIIELNNPLAKELLMFMLWERLNMLSEELEIEGLADE